MQMVAETPPVSGKEPVDPPVGGEGGEDQWNSSFRMSGKENVVTCGDLDVACFHKGSIM